MLKFLENRDEVLDLLHNLSECSELKSFRLGVAGSYAENLNKKNSAIDIVLALKEGEKESLIGDLDIASFIQEHMKVSYSNKVHLLWLDLLEKDEASLLDFMASEGLEANPESVYTNIVDSVKWVDEVNQDDTDTVSSSVVTWEDDDSDDSDKEGE